MICIRETARPLYSQAGGDELRTAWDQRSTWARRVLCCFPVPPLPFSLPPLLCPCSGAAQEDFVMLVQHLELVEYGAGKK